MIISGFKKVEVAEQGGWDEQMHINLLLINSLSNQINETIIR